ncbi:MAG: invasion associated locus B family protein [Paracoccaceae bacterium]
MRQYILAAAALPFLAFGAIAQETEAEDAPLNTAPQITAPAADIPNNAMFGDWLVNCEAVSVTRVACSIVQQLSLSENNQLVVRMVAIPAPEGTAILLAQVPMGAYLPGGAVYRFDNEDEAQEQRSMIWQRCLGDLCEAAIQLDADEMALFAENDTLLFGYRPDVEAEPIVVGLDISQFNEAIAAISDQ